MRIKIQNNERRAVVADSLQYSLFCLLQIVCTSLKLKKYIEFKLRSFQLSIYKMQGGHLLCVSPEDDLLIGKSHPLRWSPTE